MNFKKAFASILAVPVLFFAIFGSELVWARENLDLKKYLDLVVKNHRKIQAYVNSISSIEGRFAQSDLTLSPVLSSRMGYLDDRAIVQNVPTFTINRQQVRDYSLGIAKKFSTGTSASINGIANEMNLETSSTPGGDGLVKKSIGGLGIQLSQSLWKDSFGRGTRLRWEREAALRQAEHLGVEAQINQVLIEAEAAFWDVLYLQQEVTLSRASLERANKLQSWIAKRISNGIGDKADLLNARALSSVRELQLIGAEDALRAAQKKVADFLELEIADLPSLEDRLDLERKPNTSGVAQDKVTRIDTAINTLEAKARKYGSEEVEDSLRPDLSLEAAYKTNSYKDTWGEVTSNWTDRSRPTQGVGLRLTWLLDGEVKDQARNSARFEAKAAELKSERAKLESQSAWLELVRRLTEVGRQVKAAEVMVNIQRERSLAERDRLYRGRTVTSQVITAEQDAADSESTLNRLRVEHRKLEAQVRNFINFENSERSL